MVDISYSMLDQMVYTSTQKKEKKVYTLMEKMQFEENSYKKKEILPKKKKKTFNFLRIKSRCQFQEFRCCLFSQKEK